MSEEKSQNKFDERYAKLNAEQRLAVDEIDGPVLVVAGPGSGKTEILSLRVANILRRTDTPAGAILCLTFTDSAKTEMRRRLVGLIGTDAYRVQIHSFHSFGSSIIGRFPEYFWNSAEFNPSDSVTQMEVLSEIFRALPHDNPLRSEHPEQGFVFLSATLSAISNLKRAGLLPEEFEKALEDNAAVLKLIEPLLAEVFGERLSKKDFGKVEKLIAKIKTCVKQNSSLPVFLPLSVVVANSLETALTAARERDKTAPLSDWKTKWTTKDESGRRILKDSERLPKMRALCDVYKQYQKKLFEAGYYDFDDMLLSTIEVIEKTPSLQLTLQEEYQYILVDEFQDTNDAQMRLLRLLTSAEAHEGRPNVMAVGDDDQAIYKFQGAEIRNIAEFCRAYKNPTIINLSKNYRSTQKILDLAAKVIASQNTSLKTILPAVKKEIQAANPDLPTGQIFYKHFQTDLDEYQFVAKEIKKLVDSGHDPKNIAVISRTHRVLQSILPYLEKENLPVEYDKRQNVFDLPYIREIITVARFADSVARKNIDEADDLLPEILSFGWWRLPRATIWQISVAAHKEQKQWLEIMRAHTDEKARQIADFLVGLGEKAQSEPLERMVDLIVGSNVLEMPNDEEEENDVAEHSPSVGGTPRSLGVGEDLDAERPAADVDRPAAEIALPFGGGLLNCGTSSICPAAEIAEDEENGEAQREGNFGTETPQAPGNIGIGTVSPFRNFYFGDKTNSSQYLLFLSGLRVFVEALREYRQGRPLKIGDLVEMVASYEKNKMELLDESPFISAENSIKLLTAHKAKGLEFETVFILSLVDTVWDKSGRGDILPFPKNLPLAPAADENDDILRLFYVALTRAKHTLYLTTYSQNKNGRQSLPIEYLSHLEPEIISGERQGEHPLLAAWRALSRPPYQVGETAALKKILENYQMSVTHLNNFLDVSFGGPKVFLEHNLLRFPQAKTVSNVYGTAMHSVMQFIYSFLRRQGRVPTLAEALQILQKQITAGRLNPTDSRVQYDRGEKALTLYYKTRSDRFTPETKIETDFRNQGVVVGEANITGKIDKMVLSGNEIVVYDFKTSKPKTSWQGKDDYSAIQLHKNKYQLIFYKLLVENSRQFRQYQVHTGVLEFLEPKAGTLVDLSLSITAPDFARLSRLVQIVYQKILTLDFPDTAKYSPDLKGCLAFEEDLLSEKI